MGRQPEAAAAHHQAEVEEVAPDRAGQGATRRPGHDLDRRGHNFASRPQRLLNRRQRFLVTAGVATLSALVVVAAGGTWVDHRVYARGGAEVDVTIPAGASVSAIGSLLVHEHVISDPWLFRWYVRLRGAPKVESGLYAMHLHEGYSAALRDLRRGPKIVLARLTIPEGFDLPQIAARVGTLPGLSAQKFLDAVRDGTIRSRYEPPGSTSLEGLLFPDTYFVRPTETEHEIVQRMVDRFEEVATDLSLDTVSPFGAPAGWTPYQTVILASIVEREAKVDQDRGKIARVILNRLRAGMKLEVDATVEYALGAHKARLLSSDLVVDSPYNTYRIGGLPPGPIASPGRSSLAAALNPVPGAWLYYVLADANGGHAFFNTQQEFLRAKRAAQARGLL